MTAGSSPLAIPPRRTLRASRDGNLERLSARLQAELRKVRKDPADIEAVHDARVAVRRVLAAGELWAAHVPTWARVRDRLPPILRHLGRVRNIDVALELLEKGTREDQEARDALARHLRKGRRKERRKLAEWLTDKKVRRVRDRMKKVVREVQRTPSLHVPSPSDLASHFARIMSLFAGRGWTPGPEEAHAIRREVRRLRYAHETLEWAYEPKEFLGVVRLLQRIQQIAGDWQDRCVLERLASRAVRKGKVSVPVAGLLDRLRAESHALSVRFMEAASQLADLRNQIVEDVR